MLQLLRHRSYDARLDSDKKILLVAVVLKYHGKGVLYFTLDATLSTEESGHRSGGPEEQIRLVNAVCSFEG